MNGELGDYEWPVCSACQRDLWSDEVDRFCCRPCQDRTAKRLTELPGLFVELDRTAALMKGAARSSGVVSGSRTAPIPPRLDVLALVGPGGVAAALQAIEDAWRLALGRKIEPRSDGIRMFASWRIHPATAVPEHVNFLRINLERACERYESIGQDIDGIRRLHSEITAAGNRDRRPGRVQTGLCPAPIEDGTCGAQLTASTASHRIRCGTCGTEWDGLAAWRDLRRAQEAVLRRDAGVAA